MHPNQPREFRISFELRRPSTYENPKEGLVGNGLEGALLRFLALKALTVEDLKTKKASSIKSYPGHGQGTFGSETLTFSYWAALSSLDFFCYTKSPNKLPNILVLRKTPPRSHESTWNCPEGLGRGPFKIKTPNHQTRLSRKKTLQSGWKELQRSSSRTPNRNLFGGLTFKIYVMVNRSVWNQQLASHTRKSESSYPICSWKLS